MKRYYYTSQISEHIKETPEGYLLCLDVPIARTGVLEYLPEEVDMKAVEGQEAILVYRMDADFFTAATISSFEGKPLTIDHPEDFVTPETWKDLTKGIAQAIRRGEGEDQDLLLADLLITDAEAITLVRGGLREISCGYDAEYEELKPGTGKQCNIIGNHIALVQHGRCGSRCQIKDENMKKATKGSFWDKLRANIKRRAKDAEVVGEENGEALIVLTEGELEQLAKADPDEVPADLVESLVEEPTKDEQGGSVEAKLDEILIILRKLSGDKTGMDEDPTKTDDNEDPSQTGDEGADEEEKKKDPTSTGDRKSVGKKKTADADIVQRARVLAPDQHFSEGDPAMAVTRIALRDACKNAHLRTVIDSCLGGVGVDAAAEASLATALIVASETARAINNNKTADGLLAAKIKDTAQKNPPTTPADINKINQEYRDGLNGGKK